MVALASDGDREPGLLGCLRRLLFGLPSVRRRRQAGFTLAEVVVASGILAILASGVYGAMLMSQHMIASAVHHQEAKALAFDQAWTLFNADYEKGLRNYPAEGTVEPVPHESPLFPLGGVVRTWVINLGDFCIIVVRVDWNYRTLGGNNELPFEWAWIERYDTVR